MRIFVTGATGYLGGALVRRLLHEGHEVTALVRNPSRALELARLGARLVVADITDAESVLPAGTEVVVHTAFSLFPTSDRRTNVLGSLHLVQAARAANVKRFIFTSSSLVYGPNDPETPVDEASQCRPNTRFSRQQREVERELLRLSQAEGFPSVILRASELWGSDGGFFDGTVSRMRRGQLLLATGRELPLSMTELGDFVEAIVRSLVAPLAPGQIINVCTPVPVPVRALYDGIAHVLGVPPPRRLPIALIFVMAAAVQLVFAIAGQPAPFNLEIARLARFSAGTRKIDKARALLGFEPRHADPLAAITRMYAARPAAFADLRFQGRSS